MDINQATAELCGVYVDNDPYYWCEHKKDGESGLYWDYKDPRCMCLIEDALNMQTEWSDNGYLAHSSHDDYEDARAEADIPHLARVACVEAWYEQD